MKKEKFLTVFAAFDEKTQEILRGIQSQVLALGHSWTQTMDIPFHISLGSFPVEDKEKLKLKIAQVCKENTLFDVELKRINHFGDKVLFVEPTVNKNLFDLHKMFDNNYADGFDWHAHATIVSGKQEDVVKAKTLLNKIFKPMKAQITGIQMGEFFPTKMIVAKELCKER